MSRARATVSVVGVAGGMGELSPACQQYFIDEACLYECDEHAGRYRHHTNCSDEDANTWQMMGMPIKASFWDSWYEACKDDLFCGRGYFDMPTCNAETDCSKFSDIYDDAEDMATAMWNNAFTYERDEENAYTMGFEAGQPNPNDAVEHAVEFPDLCTGTKHDNITGEIKETGEVCHETSETSEPAAKRSAMAPGPKLTRLPLLAGHEHSVRVPLEEREDVPSGRRRDAAHE